MKWCGLGECAIGEQPARPAGGGREVQGYVEHVEGVGWVVVELQVCPSSPSPVQYQRKRAREAEFEVLMRQPRTAM